MSGSKLTGLILCLVIGLPPGLCSLAFTRETITMLRASGPENAFYGALFGVLCLIGFIIFAVCGVVAIRLAVGPRQ